MSTEKTTLKGLLYVKHGQVGTRSEGPAYYVQTRQGDFLLHYQERYAWAPDYHLEFYARKMVEVMGQVREDRQVQVERIHEIHSAFIPQKLS